MDSRLYCSGSWSLSRIKSSTIGGTTPNPKATRQVARRWFSEKIRTKTYGTNAPMTKPQSIATLVNIMNHIFLVPDLTSPDASAAATLPAGYSPPIPIPTRKRNAVSAAIMPGSEPPPYEPAQRAVKMIMMTVATRREFLRDHLSLV